MGKPKQCYVNLSQGSQLATHAPLGSLHSLFNDVSGFPVLFFPDGRYCFEFNSFLASLLLERKYSLVGGKGGTYTQIAADLSHLVRYMHSNRICSMEMTDSRFKSFIDGLHVGRNPDGSEIRDPNRIRAIGSTCLDFLNYMGEFHHRPNFVAPKGAIRGYLKHQVPKYKKKVAGRLRWYHFHFPNPRPENQRHPIGDISLTKLYVAAGLTGSYEVQQRNNVILSVLEHTGGRREECNNLLIADLIAALESGDSTPKVRLPTLKRGRIHFRYIPVPRIYVQQWMDYVNSTRLVCIVERGIVDDGYLFINVKTGKRLASASITKILQELRAAANLSERAHPHMFRHRFITNKLKSIMLEFDFENQDNFKRALADFSGFYEKLKQWTGHARIDSLERYIHLACSELSDLGPIVEHAQQAEAFRAVSRVLNGVKAKLDRGEITGSEYKKEFRRTIETGLGNLFSDAWKSVIYTASGDSGSNPG
ncbi:tyrosine-type recombinase/integrase [Pseudomonas taiwanensis]|uniref:tyrosine-type recombinase/integrase n=1 Tax=Pseudomonas taiwanensis TaxID=470150 RepID=UPI001646EFB4|nr:site-specific integrase [Pseudomonas taiwanensis]MBC3489409.1 tyrosine-type recombinase/integrase [Pseudomonas taiwanensis]